MCLEFSFAISCQRMNMFGDLLGTKFWQSVTHVLHTLKNKESQGRNSMKVIPVRRLPVSHGNNFLHVRQEPSMRVSLSHISC